MIMQNLVCSSEGFAALRARQFQPYVQLAAAAHSQIRDGVRFVPLRQGERLSTLGGTQISILSGKARLSSTGHTLTDSTTRAQPFMVAPRGDILQALEDAVLVLADRDFLDLVASWHELARYAQELGGVGAERLARLQRAAPFRRIPMECVAAAFARMTVRRVMAGAEIVRQGTPGDTFYTLWAGRAEVWQRGFNDQAPHKIAELRAGDTFGEEALINGGARNTSVRMASDGELLELPRTVFLELQANPPIQEVSSADAKKLLNSGWTMLDVRYAEEFQAGHLRAAQSLPLQALSSRAESVLSHTARYVVACTSGKRSAVAALLLAQRGYPVASLKNGLREADFDLVTHAAHAAKAVA